MANNIYISENLQYLVSKNRLSNDEFGKLFKLKRGVIGQYIRNTSLPKIETLVLICDHFNITIDRFVREDMGSNYYKPIVMETMMVNETNEGYNLTSPETKYVEMLEYALEDKNKLIKIYETQLGIDKSKAAS